SIALKPSRVLFYAHKTVQVPPFAESVTEGDIKWIKSIGDTVSQDEVVGEVETDKTTVPVPAPFAGKIISFLVQDGSKVTAKQDLFVIDDSVSGASNTVETPVASSGPITSQTIQVPPFAESVTEGDIKWLKQVGEFVAQDELVGEVETDKTTVPLPAPFSGKIIEILVENGSKVTAKQDIYKLQQSDAPTAAQPKKTQETQKLDRPVSAAEKPVLKVLKPPSSSTELKLNNASVAPLAASSGPRSEQRVKMTRMRMRIAQRLKESQNTCAMLTTFNEIDMSNLIEMRKKYKEAFLKKHGVKLGIMSAFTKAAAYALQDQPVVNAVIDGEEIVYRDYVDISIAVATPKGLVVPVLRNCEQMNYVDIEKGIFELGEKAKLGKLAIEDMDNGTFTISNGGVFGSLFGTPIINPPQSAILGMHGSFNRPIALNGQVVIRPMMYVALTYDHRLIDGREAVTFLRKIKNFIEDPQTFFLGL
ncbi:hypothetical protein Ciccas_013447, partial [Cichlidogyrus casuarinus]